MIDLFITLFYPVGHLETNVKEKGDRGEEHNRQPCVDFDQKRCFVRKKVVQLFKVRKSKKCVGRPGSIPEWKVKKVLLKVEWFNSLKGFRISFAQSQQGGIP